MLPQQPRSTSTDTLFPYPTLVRVRQEVRTGAHPATSAPCEKFQSLIVPTARQFDIWEPAGQEMHTAHVAGAFLDCHDVPGLSDPGQVVLAHAHPHTRRVVVEHDGQVGGPIHRQGVSRSEEHTSELQSLMRISYAVFCLKQKTTVA